jgi:hypothetical protein
VKSEDGSPIFILRLLLDDCERERNARGFIVVAVLWMLAALSALVLIYLTYVTNTALVVAGSTDRAGGDPIRRHSGPTETCWHR